MNFVVLEVYVYSPQVFTYSASIYLRLEFTNHYVIRQLPLKEKGFIMFENSLVATSYV